MSGYRAAIIFLILLTFHTTYLKPEAKTALLMDHCCRTTRKRHNSVLPPVVPCRDDVGKLRCVRGNFHCDWLKEHEVLVDTDGVGSSCHVFQPEGSILLAYDCEERMAIQSSQRSHVCTMRITKGKNSAVPQRSGCLCKCF